ncbi:unnamed protein product [Hermetia illucens]|uniref:Ionotropic receptor n=1 Tax=Hermetia illucens TaxID=343691 RepID=A0A7R8URH7_HERIL|nr:unnamed protein product [Hermetia illucens]
MGIQRLALLFAVLGALSSLFTVETQMGLREIVDELQELHHFRTAIYFLTNVTEQERMVFMDRWNPRLVHIPTLLIQDTFKNEIWEKIPKSTLTIFFIPSTRQTEDLELPQDTLGPFLRSQIIFDIHTGNSTRFDLKEFCGWLWSRRIVNSLILLNNRTFIFDPYPIIIIKELTSSVGLQAAYATRLSSFHGATVKVAKIESLVTYFKYFDISGNLIYGGHIIKIIFAFLQKFNGTFVECCDAEQHEHHDVISLLKSVRDKEFTISPLAAMVFNEGHEMAHPAFEKFCVIVPYQRELPRMHYLKLPFQTNTWCLYGTTLLFLFLIEVLIDVLFDFPNDIFQGSHAFFRVVRIATAQSHFRSRLNQIRSIYLIHFGAIWLLGLIASVYQCGLSSFYTKSIPGVQINHINELENSEYKILIRTQFANFSALDNFLPQHLLEFSYTKEPSFELAKLNTKYGYFLPNEFIKIEAQIENMFSVKFYHLTHICNFKGLIGISLENGFPLKEALDDTISRLWEAGIISHWKKHTVYELHRSGHFSFNITKENKLRSLKLDELRLAWLIYAVGICFSTIFFCWEKGKYLRNVCRISRSLKK